LKRGLIGERQESLQLSQRTELVGGYARFLHDPRTRRDSSRKAPRTRCHGRRGAGRDVVRRQQRRTALETVNAMNSPLSLNQYLISLYRIVLGLLIACHGASTLFGVFGGAVGTGKTVSPTVWPGGVAALIQLVCGLLVLFGLGTRAAAVVLSGSMAYAYFTVHQKHALLPIENGGEPAALFSWGFVMIAILGPGNWSLDGIVSRVRGRSGSPEAAMSEA
jgi:putative oxidoreductase